MALAPAARMNYKSHGARTPLQSNTVPEHHEQQHVPICRSWLQNRCTKKACRFAHPSGAPPLQRTSMKAWHRAPGTSASQHHADVQADASVPPYYKPSPAASFSPSRTRVEEPRACTSQQSPAVPRRKLRRSWTPDRPESISREASSKKVPHAVHIEYEATCRPGHTPLTMSSTLYCGSSTLVPPESQQKLAPSLISTANVAQLTGHQAGTAAIRGMALPLSSSTLFTIGDEAAVRAWSYTDATAHGNVFTCYGQLLLPHCPNCLFNSFCDPDWLFIGLANEVRVCYLPTHTQHSLSVSSAVLSITSSGNLLLAGLDDGSILMWRFDPSSSSFHAMASLNSANTRSSSSCGQYGAHDINMLERSPVLSMEPACLAPGFTIVYVGLANGMIQVWDVAAGRCCQKLSGAHSKAVTHLLAGHHGHPSAPLLLSASQDGTVKLWTISAASNNLELQCTLSLNVKREEAVGCTSHESMIDDPSALCGVVDSDGRSILFVGYRNGEVHILELPSLARVGTISTSSPIGAMDTGPSHRLLLGSTTGDLSLWKWK